MEWKKVCDVSTAKWSRLLSVQLCVFMLLESAVVTVFCLNAFLVYSNECIVCRYVYITLLRSADFAAVLKTQPNWRSSHVSRVLCRNPAQSHTVLVGSRMPQNEMVEL